MYETIRMIGIAGYGFENQMYNVYIAAEPFAIIDRSHSPGKVLECMS